MRTIFISSFHQLISRNILRTPLIEILLVDSEVCIVLLVPEDKRVFFTKEFERDRVVVEGVSRAMTRRDIFLRYLVLSSVTARGIEVIRKREYDRLRSRLLRVLGRRVFGQGLIRRLDKWFTPRGRFGALLDRYKPVLVFSTDVQNENDVRLMHEARSYGIPIVGMVRSWDNFTTKGALRVIPDTLVVTSEIVKREAMNYSFVPEDRIMVVGIPHYDRYIEAANQKPRTQNQNDNSRLKITREEFCAKNNLDPGRKIVLFAPIGDRYIRDNLLDKAVLETLAELDVNILVRMPPSDYVMLDNWRKGKANVVFDQPGRGAPGGEKNRKLNEVGLEDDDRLIAELTNCDAVVTGQSTITVDASIFDKPIVIVNFDQDGRSYWESIKRYYDSEYYRPVAESGGARFANGIGEINQLVTQYLENPCLDEDGRKRIAEGQAYKLDGKATERLAQVLFSSLR